MYSPIRVYLYDTCGCGNCTCRIKNLTFRACTFCDYCTKVCTKTYGMKPTLLTHKDHEICESSLQATMEELAE